MMSFYLSKEEKAEYEQRRRKLIIQESRDYRLMHRWLMKAHPDILAEHFAFRAKLRKDNPIRKDLSTAPQFHKFMRGGRWYGIRFVVFFLGTV